MKNILAQIGLWIYENMLKPLPQAVFNAAMSTVLKTWIVAILTLVLTNLIKLAKRTSKFNLAA